MVSMAAMVPMVPIDLLVFRARLVNGSDSSRLSNTSLASKHKIDVCLECKHNYFEANSEPTLASTDGKCLV